MHCEVVTAPATEPITAAECRTHSRIDDSGEDTVLATFIDEAIKHCESYTGRQMITATYDGYLDRFPRRDYIEVPKPPLQSVTSVQYYDQNGSLQTLASSTYYVDTNRWVGRIRLRNGESWPNTESLRDGAVVVRFVCGYGDAATDVPSNLLLAMRMMVDHRYDADRGSTGWEAQNTTIGRASGVFPAAVYRAMDPERVHTLCHNCSD